MSLDNLTRRRCNYMPTPTCVMCHADVESVDHLFTLCPFASLIWSHFGQLFGLRESPYSLTELWGNLRSSISKSIRVCWDMLIRAIIWNIWLERNARIFNFTCASSNSIVAKIVHMVLLWFNAGSWLQKGKIGGTNAENQAKPGVPHY